MSHTNSNHRPFHLTIQAPDQYPYDPQSSLGTGHSWVPLPSGARNLLSPSVSIDSAIVHSSHRSFDHGGQHLPNLSPIEDRLDPSLLSIPTVNVPRNAYDNLGQNDESWNPWNMRTGSGNDDRTRLAPVQPNFKGYRNGPGSVGSAAPVSDSGFYSQSVQSNEPGRASQELPSSLTSQVGNMHVSLRDPEASQPGPVPSDQRSHASSVSARQEHRFQCQECSESFKCKSDYKKHDLRHKKPFVCDVHDCKRQGRGFTTVNDLDRHKKSVHRVGLLFKSYQCASESCRNRDKIWPRLDNFKQHIDRMHKGEDHTDLIKRSVYSASQIPETIVENDVVAPNDTLLFSGMDKQPTHDDRYGVFVQDMNQWHTDVPMDDLSSNYPPQSNDMSHLSRRSSNSLSGLSPGHQTTYKSNRLSVPSHNGLNTRPQPKVSELPQTKAQQQQQQAQHQGFKAGAVNSAKSPEESSSASEASVKQLLSAIIGGADGNGGPQSSKEASIIHNDEVVKAVQQVISNLLKQNSESGSSQPRSSHQPVSSGYKKCSKCEFVGRACDLRKHMMRHDRPYGCTFGRCHKRFGAKSDWKRHENSQHFQLEAYRCRQPNMKNGICGQHFLRVERFNNHLQTEHGMVCKDARTEEIKARRIGKNYQVQFWCGFCKDIVELQKKRNEAWDERFDHIANHFQKEGKRIEEWVSAEEDRPKGELLEDADRNSFDDDDDENGFKPHDDPNGPPPDVPSHIPPTQTFAPPPPLGYQIEEQIAMNSRGIKRAGHAFDEMQSSGRKKPRVTVNYCCQCQDQLSTVSRLCMNCNHERCSNCEGVYAEF